MLQQKSNEDQILEATLWIVSEIANMDPNMLENVMIVSMI